MEIETYSKCVGDANSLRAVPRHVALVGNPGMLRLFYFCPNYRPFEMCVMMMICTHMFLFFLFLYFKERANPPWHEYWRMSFMPLELSKVEILSKLVEVTLLIAKVKQGPYSRRANFWNEPPVVFSMSMKPTRYCHPPHDHEDEITVRQPCVNWPVPCPLEIQSLS
jgi:hypothetical protein